MDSGKIKRGLLASVSALLFGAGGGAALAQDDAVDNGASQRDVITVTAQRREQALQDVPMKIGVLSDEELNDRGMTDLADVSFAIPELTIYTPNPGGGFYSLRGISATEGDSLVGVYFDEAPVTGPAGGVQPDLRVFDLERIEILHGPQGTLYGQGSAGGTIRLITKDPVFGELGGQVRGVATFTEHGEPSQTVQGVINMPLGENFAVRVAASQENIGGWANTSDGRKNVNDQNISYLRVKALWEPVPELSLKATGVVHRNKAGFALGGVDENLVINLPEYAPNVDLPNENSYNLFNLTGTYDLGFAELLSSTSYLDIDDDIAFKNDFFVTERLLLLDKDYQAFSQEIRLVSTGEKTVNWSIGGIYNDTDYTSDLDITIGIGPNIIRSHLLLPSAVKQESWAVFGDINFQLTDRLNVGGGLRYYADDKSSGGQTASFDSVDPRLYITFDVTDDVSFYGNAAEGFRSGGFNSLNPTFPATYDSETVRSYEAGVKMAAANGRLTADLAFFYSKYKDMQSQVETPAGLGYIGNLGESVIKGIDLNFQALLTDNFTLSFGGNLINTEVTDIPAGSARNVGDQLDLIPDYSYTVSANYDVQWTPEISGFLRLDYNEQGKATYVIRNFGIFDESEVGNLLNFKANASWRNVSVELFAQNILNDNDRVNPSPTNFSVRPRPRTFGVAATATF